MNHLTYLVSTVVLSSALSAQVTFTAPLGYDTVEGNYYGHSLGSYSTGRYQAVEGSLKGQGTRIMKRVEYRYDLGTNYTPAEGMGRSWTSVTLDVCGTDITKLTATFSTNIIGTPTRVFSGQVSWSTVSGKITSNPWGQGGLSFPFSQVTTYSGQNDLMLDYSFQGGVLKNNAAWTYQSGGQTFSSSMLFRTDGIFMGDDITSFPVYVPRGTRVAPICTDAGQAGTFSSWAHHFYLGYSDTHPTTSLRGKIRMRVQTYYTAKSAPVVGAITLKGSEVGVSLPGFGCNNLHVDLSGPALYLFATTDANGLSGWLIDTTLTPPAGLRGLTTWFQAAWTDSITGQAKLTLAQMSTIPPKPIPSTKRSVYINLVSSPTAFGVYDIHYVHSLPRFSVQ